MLSTAAPDFRPGSSLFGPVERRSVTLVSGRLGGVRCGLSGPAPVQARRIGPRVHLWPIGAAVPACWDELTPRGDHHAELVDAAAGRHVRSVAADYG